MAYRYFAYVKWNDVSRYEAAGWRHPRTQVAYARLAEYGTTMEWEGEGDPPEISEDRIARDTAAS